MKVSELLVILMQADIEDYNVYCGSEEIEPIDEVCVDNEELVVILGARDYPIPEDDNE